jgi:hypothetical protein
MVISRLGRTFVLASCASVVVLSAACAKTVDSGVLQDADLAPPEGATEPLPFDKNTLVDSAAFTDVEGLDVTIIQAFLHRTSYDRPSFLETYESNGVRASDAIARAARAYRINPLAFLVAAEVAQGLLGDVNYPFPPERVEYVFKCGCAQDQSCLPELAGFDRQVDCLGRRFRVALDAQKVTPTTEATAAIYDYTPRVDEGGGSGSFVFWNVWNLYASTTNYEGPLGGDQGGGWIGDPCTSTARCAAEGSTCALDYPGGLCTLSCNGDCPSLPDRGQTFCADFTGAGFCLAVCSPSESACRDGYTCARLKRFGSPDTSDSEYVCIKQ